MEPVLIIWDDIRSRDSLFDALHREYPKLEVSTELDDGVFWINTGKPKVSVYATGVVIGQEQRLIDRILELRRMRGTKYVCLHTTNLDQDKYHELVDAVFMRDDSIMFFDPVVKGLVYERLCRDFLSVGDV